MWVSRGGSWPLRTGEPPPPEFFSTERPALGDEAVSIDLEGVALRFEGLDGELAEALRRRFGVFVSGAAADPLRVRVGVEAREYFLEPSPRPEFTAVFLACDGAAVRYLSYRAAGRFAVGPGGEGVLLLAKGTFEPVLRTFENYVRAAVAWQAASRGGALVHAASAVRNGKGYLFYGESGAGKSTFAEVNRRGVIVSDDLSLVLPGEGGRAELAGSPFRGTYEEGEPVRGRFPLAAAFRLVQGERAEVVRVPRVLAFGQLVGNLAFLAEGFDARPDLFASVERVFAAVPLFHLRFRKDDSYWDALDGAGL
jgi:hypothetical protein